MRILITNNSLANRAGTELYVRDVAIGLTERGHEVTAYSTEIGEVAQELVAAGVRVISELDPLAERFDLIHGQHHLEAMTALLSLPGTPAIYFCHGSTPWQEAAPKFPRILRYVAVDHACRDRLVLQHAISPERIQLILNFIDLQRFKPRIPLPVRPTRALIFSNQASEENYVGVVRSACEQAGVSLDVLGSSSGTACADPEKRLGSYDIVFAKGRAALEALAVGAAVIVCDAAGLGPMVTMQNVSSLRPLNFGIRLLSKELTMSAIADEIANYNPIDAVKVCALIRGTAGRDMVINQLLSLYREVIDEHARMPAPDRLSELQAVAAYLCELKPQLQAAEELAATTFSFYDRRLAASEARLERITTSLGWKSVSRYVSMKQQLLRTFKAKQK